MARTYIEKTLLDGTILHELFEEDVVVGTIRTEKARDGKMTRREFDAAGNLVEEFHNRGKLLAFALVRKYSSGVLVEETYFKNRRLITRKAYLKSLADFSDMPPPSSVLPDMAAELEALISDDRRRKKAGRSKRVPDPARASANDSFCRKLMKTGDVRDARRWFDETKACLGERDRRASRNLLGTIYRRGAVRVWACDIQTEPDGVSGTSHLVVQLPALDAARAALLKYLARPAGQQGLEGDLDDGQQYVYVKLD